MSHRLLAALAAVLLATGCASSGGEDDPGPRAAEQELLAQRDAVEQTAQGLVATTRQVLGGRVIETRGGWEGCTSRFPEGYEDFRYAADVRLDARPGTPADVGADLRTIAGRSGYAVADGDQVEVTDGSVSAALLDVPDGGAEGDVLIRLAAGPCVDVPEDEWQDWMDRDDPGPQV